MPQHSHSTSRAQGTETRDAILKAAVLSFGRRGYYGTSLQQIADTVGVTKQGVLHHVGSKEGLLNLVLSEIYDSRTGKIIEDFRRIDSPHISDLWRRTVAINAQRPQEVQMFSTLDAEAIDPEHPAHDYFAQRDRRSVQDVASVPWAVPQGIDVQNLLVAGFSMMDGLQLRWLRAPREDLNRMWGECEDALLPMPLWEGYR